MGDRKYPWLTLLTGTWRVQPEFLDASPDHLTRSGHDPSEPHDQCVNRSRTLMRPNAGLLDFREDALHLLQLVAELVEPHTYLGEPEVGVLLGGDRHVAEPTVLVGKTAVLLAGSQRHLAFLEALRCRDISHTPHTIATASEKSSTPSRVESLNPGFI